MSYSLDRLPNAPYEFPAPPKWLTWIEERPWNYRTRSYDKSDGTGQVRHFHDLSKAKKRISQCAILQGESQFRATWAVYCWDDDKGEYVLQYEGSEGESKDLNALFRTRVRKGDKTARPGFEEEEAAAIQSILRAAAS